jgi:DNA repair exonuclease SbcCD ATPase subunit
VGYNRRYLQQQTIDKLIAIRNLTEKYDDNAVLRAQVKELEKERDELLEKEGGVGTGSSEDLDELKEELEGVKEELEEAQEAVRELEEQEEENERKGNNYDILAQVLDRLGVNVEKVKSEGMEFGAQDFITTQAFEDLVVEPIERSLFR